MSLIKSAIIYKAQIPTDPDLLHSHLSEQAFTPPMSTQAISAGFAPVVGADVGCHLVATFPGGLAFAVRVDEKILPGSVLRAKQQEALKQFEHDNGRKPGKILTKDIKEKVHMELLAVAMVKTTAVINCFYRSEAGHLVINTTSKRLADICTSLLIQAVGSVKTETIHVSNVKHGLTTRLKNWLKAEDDAEYTAPDGEQSGFGDFEPASNVAMTTTGEIKRKLSLSVDNLSTNLDGLIEAITKGYEVTSLGLDGENISFRITDEFRLKGIRFVMDDEPSEEDDVWAATAGVEVAILGKAIDAMIEIFSYKQDEEGEAA